MDQKEWKVLCVGNSFSQDTLRNLAQIAGAMGMERVKLVNLFYSACSIRQHYYHAANDLAAYRYDLHTGPDWPKEPGARIGETVASEDWDWICIQHGSGDGSFYTRRKDYSDLPDLVKYIKAHAWEGTKLVFNMTWVGEPDMPREEIIHYGGDQLLIYNKITKLTRELVAPMEGIDLVVPTGTAVQNARTADLGRLTRDKYHLTKDTGCYIAGLTFFQALTGTDISSITWAPEGTDAHAKEVAIEAANAAIKTPYAITPSRFSKP